MICPKCGEDGTLVRDSRERPDGRVIRRRRKCLACNHRFTTWEGAAQGEIMDAGGDAFAAGRSPLRREIMEAAETMKRSDIVLLVYMVRRLRGLDIDLLQMNADLAKALRADATVGRVIS